MKIISGGQTGADQAGLFVAKDFNFETGGHAPSEFKTLAGCTPMLGTEFGLQTTFSSNYPPRTEMNVQNSNCTLLLCKNFKSPGTKCTMRFINKHKKPFLKIDLNNQTDPFIVAKWIRNNKFDIINIAGNGDGKENGVVYNLVYNYLFNVFEEYKKL